MTSIFSTVSSNIGGLFGGSSTQTGRASDPDWQARMQKAQAIAKKLRATITERDYSWVPKRAPSPSGTIGYSVSSLDEKSRSTASLSPSTHEDGPASLLRRLAGVLGVVVPQSLQSQAAPQTETLTTSLSEKP